VPWLCAYTGARVNEMTQLTVRSIKCEGGIWIIDINPLDGDVKTQVYRDIPIHQHLIDQGFLEFVKSRKRGPLFYKKNTGKTASAANPTYVRMGQKLAPNHGWRHLFKTRAREAGVPDARIDVICGHAPASEGRKYGDYPPHILAPEIAKIPHFVVKPARTVDRRTLRRGRASHVE
jgi:integrase